MKAAAIYIPTCIQTVWQIYCIGDSLMANGEVESRLTTLLGTWPIVKNKGVGGQNSTQILSRFTTDIITPRNAKYVIIWAGINDAQTDVLATTAEANLQSMYTAAYNAGIKVVSVNLSCFKDDGNWNAGRQAILDAINTWIASTAININYRIDVNTLLTDPGNAYQLLPAYDGGNHIHLTTAGYDVVAGAIYAGVTWTL